MDYYLTLASFGDQGWGDEIALGVLVTISLAIVSLPFGLLLGFLLALAKKSKESSLRMAANIYTTIFRGLPELLTLFLVYYGAQILILAAVKAFNPNASVEINSFVAGVVALSFVFSSYASEAFLSAFRGIPEGQYEGGAALGLNKFKVMRLIVFPQLMKLSLPALGNLWLVLLKDTALVSVIGLEDTIRWSGIAARVAKEPFFFFSLACVIYLILSIISSFGIHRIEKWARRGEEPI